MNIAIIGSRDFKDYKLMKDTLDDYIIKNVHTIIEGQIKVISGGAPGADTMAIRYAKEMGYQWEIKEAKWDDLSHPDARIKVNKYGKQYDANAGFRRNTLIIQESDLIIAFHNGSPGTADSIRKAKALGKKVIEFIIEIK